MLLKGLSYKTPGVIRTVILGAILQNPRCYKNCYSKGYPTKPQVLLELLF